MDSKTKELLTESYWLADKVLFNLAINHKNKMPWQVDLIAELKEELSKQLSKDDTAAGQPKKEIDNG